jgi:hypothetical protein
MESAQTRCHTMVSSGKQPSGDATYRYKLSDPLHFTPRFNVVNHKFHGVDTSKYGAPTETAQRPS